MECKNQPDSYMNCHKKNGQYYWEVNDNIDLDQTCPENSQPWRMHALCNVESKSQCYETNFDDEKLAVCVVPTKEKTILNECGQKYINQPHLIENDKLINDAKYFDDKVICTKQNIGQLQNAELVTWVSKENKDLCDKIVEEAELICADKSDCNYKVEKMLIDDDVSVYDCVLDTKNIPSDDKSPQWWDWNRINSYECKDNGWTCSDDSLKEYKGGKICNMNDDCHKNAEFGICKNKKCAVGPATGSNCSKDEDCDRLNGIEGKCSNDRCSSGKNGIITEYIKPKDCDSNNKNYPYSLHQYCGETEIYGSSVYTGYCESVGNSSKTACKAFSSTQEILYVQDEEENYLRGIRHPRNFYEKTPPWQNLSLCPDDEKISVNGRTFCGSSVDRLNVYLGRVSATDTSSANIKCANEYNVPVVALPSF